jgi:hypothetical protein
MGTLDLDFVTRHITDRTAILRASIGSFIIFLPIEPSAYSTLIEKSVLLRNAFKPKIFGEYSSRLFNI